MLFMVVERFRGGDASAVAARFRAHGRLIPADSGAEYVASWMAADGASCYQIMKAPTRSALDGWLAAWADLVDFEVTEIAVSADWWAQHPDGRVA